MATATVIFSGPAYLKNNAYAELTTTFRPPSNVNGRSCYLKVTNICCLTAAGPLDPFNVYFLTCDLPQPYSYASINENDIPGITSTPTMFNPGGRNRVIHTFTTGGDIEPHTSHYLYWPPECQITDPIRILVEIPNGPQSITFQLWKATEAVTHALTNMTIMAELTPIDTGVHTDLSI